MNECTQFTQIEVERLGKLLAENANLRAELTIAREALRYAAELRQVYDAELSRLRKLNISHVADELERMAQTVERAG